MNDFVLYKETQKVTFILKEMNLINEKREQTD